MLFQNCATIIESNCELTQFEGTYIGFYRIADLIDVTDTVKIEVDLAANEAKVTSSQLDTFFIAKFLSTKSELTINPIVIPVFQVGELTFTNASIGSGFAKLDGECNDLFIEMNRITVTHNFAGLPNPLRNVKLDTPEFLTRQ
jgi:hypothetical protein